MIWPHLPFLFSPFAPARMPYTPAKSMYSGNTNTYHLYTSLHGQRLFSFMLLWFWTWCCLLCLKVLSPTSPSATILLIFEDPVPASSLWHHLLTSHPWARLRILSMPTIPCFPLSLYYPVPVCRSVFTAYCELLSHILAMYLKYKAGHLYVSSVNRRK